MKTYSIIRFYHPLQDKENETIETDLTLEQAQEHCRDPETSVQGQYFDGYESE